MRRVRVGCSGWNYKHWREAFPVVVEVREDSHPLAPAADALRPLVELRLGVVAVPPAPARVEADEREVGRQLMGLERPARIVADDQRDVVPAQELVHGVREPRRLAELERVATGRKVFERALQPVVVALERRRELPQDRCHLRRGDERRDPCVEEPLGLVQVAQPLHMRDVPAHLDREDEV